MTKSTPRKRTTRAAGAATATGTRKRATGRSARKKDAPTKKTLAAAGEPKPARRGATADAEKPPAPTLADYSAEVQDAVRAAAAKKAERITVLDLRHTPAFTDVFVVCTGQNARQVKAIVDNVEEALRVARGQKPVAVEGYRDSEWVLVDYFDFVVHVFTPETREFYALERLWGSATRVEIPDDVAARPA